MQYASQVDFLSARGVGGIVGLPESKSLKDFRTKIENKTVDRVQCFPFFSVMSALGNPRVDYFSLDVEGSELAILKTIPFDQVRIGVMTIEVNHYPKAGQRAIKRLMADNGFALVKDMYGQDLVFKNKNF